MSFYLRNTYTKLAIISSIMMLISSSIEYVFEFDIITLNIINFITDFLIVINSIFIFLWIKRELLYFAFLGILLSTNISLLFNPLFGYDNQIILCDITKWIEVIFFAISLLIIFIGMSEKVKYQFLDKKSKYELKEIIRIAIFRTFVFQIAIRLLT